MNLDDMEKVWQDTSSPIRYVCDIYYCLDLNLFHKEPNHCLLCQMCIALIPLHCLPAEIKVIDDPKTCCWFPLNNSIKENDKIYYTLDGEHWIEYRS
jgi:hypothetical protein